MNSTLNNPALITSIIAIAVSTLTLGWTIYRDAIRKPKFRVSIAVKTIVQRGRPPAPTFLALEALNLGPIPNRISMPFARKNWIRRLLERRHSTAFITPDFAHTAASPAAARIEVGDKGTFAFPYNTECFLSEGFVQIGITDGFGRVHWAPRNQLRKLRKKFTEEFPENRPA